MPGVLRMCAGLLARAMPPCSVSSTQQQVRGRQVAAAGLGCTAGAAHATTSCKHSFRYLEARPDQTVWQAEARLKAYERLAPAPLSSHCLFF